MSNYVTITPENLERICCGYLDYPTYFPIDNKLSEFEWQKIHEQMKFIAKKAAKDGKKILVLFGPQNTQPEVIFLNRAYLEAASAAVVNNGGKITVLKSRSGGKTLDWSNLNLGEQE